MPVSGAKSTNSEKGPGGGGRTTFRPPWVKEGSEEPATKPKSAPWLKRNTPSTTTNDTTTVTATATTTKGNTTKENGQNTQNANKTTPPSTSATTSKPAPIKEAKLQSREVKVPVITQKTKPIQPPLKPAVTKKTETTDSDIEREIEEQIEKEREKKFRIERPKLRHVEINKDKKDIEKSTEIEIIEPKLRPVLKKTAKIDEPNEPSFKDKVLKKVTPPDTSSDKNTNTTNAPVPPPLPSSIPKAPPPPPPSGLAPPDGFQKRPLSDTQKETLEKLKVRARRRPDWSEMMKEVEEGRKLRHVECNDRSKPIITKKSITKVGGQFIYETEKANIHNQLLKQIQTGVKLRPTKCNDRSKPILEGLRKFRRQMTIEEQIQKSESRAALNEAPPEEESADEMDDIDKLRDDLQSTKQLLALELRNKEAQERENKRLLAKIANLEAELEREKSKINTNEKSELKSTGTTDDILLNSLKQDAEDARKISKDLEKKYQESAEQLDTAKGKIEEQKYQISQLEKKLSQALQVNYICRPQYSFCYSYEDPNDSDTYIQGIPPCASTRRISEAGQKESSPEFEIESSESESDEDEEKKAAKKARRLSREVKMLRIKLNRFKEKQSTAKKERTALKEAMKRNQTILKEENKKFKKLEKEVKKMAKLMEADENDEDEKEDKNDDEIEEEIEEEEEETETEEETESEESEEEESDSETESESEDEIASDEAKKKNLEPRVKRHEGRLTALKKGNYLLQANVDRLQDEINKIREKAVSLQAELDSVLSELG